MQQRTDRKPIGVLARESIKPRGGRPAKEIIDRFLAIEDLSGTVSDVLDRLDIRGAVGASLLLPTITTSRIAGAAVTVRSVPQDLDPLQSVSTAENRMTEIVGINQAEPGDVLVIREANAQALAPDAETDQSRPGCPRRSRGRFLTSQRVAQFLVTDNVAALSGRCRWPPWAVRFVAAR